MKALLLFLFSFILIVSTVSAETSVWVAKTDSSKMYIGGTIHLLRESDYPLPVEIDRAYDSSEIVVFETDIAELQKPEFQQKLLAKAFYTDGRTLDKVLSPETYQALDSFCTERTLTLATMNQLKPSLVVWTLAMIELKKLGVTEQGIDLVYHGKATMDQKPIEDLESPDEQIRLLTSMGDGEEDGFINYSLRDLKNISELFDKLLAAWKIGDEQALFKYFVEEMKRDYPVLYKTTLVDRNMNWMPQLEQHLLTTETEFIMVGSAHLVGEDGVIAQLKKLGYEVEKLK